MNWSDHKNVHCTCTCSYSVYDRLHHAHTMLHCNLGNWPAGLDKPRADVMMNELAKSYQA